MDILDVGCGPGSITTGLARAVAPGRCTGIDPDADALNNAKASFVESNLEFQPGVVEALPFPGNSFDAAFAHAVFQHIDDPVPAMAEMFRVLRPGGIIGIADADFGGSIIGPSSPALDMSIDLMSRLRRGRGDPFVGRKLGALLAGAGFEAVAVGARADVDSGFETTERVGAFQAAYFGAPELRAYAAATGLASAADLDAITEAWATWGRTSGAVWARFWCYATARKPEVA
jgi:SAM-dependent methyltransferase